MADVKEYGGITKNGIDNLRKDLQSVGITAPPGNNGEIEYQGVKLNIDYKPSAQTLTVRILEKPIFIPEDLIWQMLDGRVLKCMGQ
ncbi:MAG: hypothetical protein ACRD10_04965 [Terriglobia bacterium]